MKLINIAKKLKKKNDPHQNFRGLKQFGIEDYEITDYVSYRALLRKKYRELCKKHHPDTSTRKQSENCHIKLLTKAYKKMSRFPIVPITTKNINQVLRLTKGYKSLDDVDWGMNFRR